MQHAPLPDRPMTIYVTPKLAHEWLSSRNKGNRSIGQGVAKRYAEAMKEGRWKLTHQGIAFDRDGLLLDGQHRLMAVILAQISVPFWIIPDCDRETFDVLDVGRRRTAGHLIEHPNANTIAAAARFVGAIDGTLDTNRIVWGVLADRAENNQVLDVVNNWPELVEHAESCDRARKAARIPSSMHLAVIAQAARTVHRHLIDPWIDGLSSGVGLADDDPRLHLRNRFMRDAAVRGGGNWNSNSERRVLAYSLIIRAWNHWAVGRRMRILKTIRTEEAVPSVAGFEG